MNGPVEIGGLYSKLYEFKIHSSKKKNSELEFAACGGVAQQLAAGALSSVMNSGEPQMALCGFVGRSASSCGRRSVGPITGVGGGLLRKSLDWGAWDG